MHSGRLDQKLPGLIQHAFALQIAKAHAPFRGLTNWDRMSERFALPAHRESDEFRLSEVGTAADASTARRSASHSPLLRAGQTAIRIRGLNRLAPSPDGRREGGFPDALSWAGKPSADDRNTYKEPRLILAGRAGASQSCNDFLVARRSPPSDPECDALTISATLLEVIAHRRSRLFGLALANRFVNVMLPHAILVGRGPKAGDWLLQPVVTFTRDTQEEKGFRSAYSLSIFLVPVTSPHSKPGKREMPRDELRSMVNAGWGLATSPPDGVPPKFELCGPLPDYVARLAGLDLHGMLGPPTLRSVTELVAFGVSLRTAEGSNDRATEKTRRAIGDDVITALGSARVSSVVVVDEKLDKGTVSSWSEEEPVPDELVALMRTLSGDSRVPEAWTRREQRRYRLDRPFVDGDEAAVGVLPHGRCMIVVSAGDSQCGRLESALMQAGSVAYMTLGAATSIGMLRAIDRDLEGLGGHNPTRIAEIDAEIANDLGDIYDLDITRESYRRLYRRLRNRLGITRDYKTLQEKMGSLYQAASTKNLQNSNLLLVALTALALLLALVQALKT